MDRTYLWYCRTQIIYTYFERIIRIMFKALKKLQIIFILVISSLCFQMKAKVIPGSPFNDGMVLQQKSKVLLWGTAAPNSTVKIVGSWNYKMAKTTAAANGKWTAYLTTPKGSFTSYAVTITDGSEPVIIRDVLIGEVWLASGQSNMEMPLEGWTNYPLNNSPQVIAASIKYSGKLHFAKVDNICQREPQTSVPTKWKNCVPENSKDLSAVAYYFAAALIDKLQCPVGIINDNWGGSIVEAWLPAEILQGYKNVDLSDKAYKELNNHTPAGLYNGKIYPLRGYTLAGFIWYQGESNVNYAADQYATRFTDMITRWRNDWGKKDLPFYYVQIAPFAYNKNLNTTASASLREQQTKASHMLKNLGMVCTNDLVTPEEINNIHPGNKQPVGQRLANWALSKTYKQSGIEPEGPEFKKMKVSGKTVFLSFTNTKDGFNRKEDIVGFEICGADSIFHPAKAIVNDNTVIVTAPEVDAPLFVRYCFKDFLIGNLANNAGLPVFPFRTDNFPH